MKILAVVNAIFKAIDRCRIFFMLMSMFAYDILFLTELLLFSIRFN